MGKRALLLFAHGARNPEWAAPFERLRAMVQALAPDAIVALGYLELMKPTLAEAVRELAQGGCSEVTVVPVFLAQAGHLVRDLPRLVEQVRQSHPMLGIRVAEAVGEDEEVLQAIARYCARNVAR